VQQERKVQKNGTGTAGFFCTTVHMHVLGGQKVPNQAQCNSFGASIFLELVTTTLFLVSATKNHSERTIRKQ
jgi:hypothetical protein